MKYFRLYPFCRFVHEKDKGCLYDLSSGTMWDLEEKNVKLLAEAEANKPVEVNSFFDLLSRESLGNYYDNPIWIDHDDFGINKAMMNTIGRRPHLNKLFIVFNKCSLSCEFCSPSLNRQTGCKKHDAKETLNLSDLIKVIDDARNFGCEEVIYIGGDPLLYRELLTDMIKECYSKVKKQEVYTNGSLLDNEWFELFATNKVKLNLQIVTQSDMSGEEGALPVKAILDDSLSHGIETSLSVLVNRNNQCAISQIIEIASKYDVKCTLDSIVEPIEHRVDEWAKILGKGKHFQIPINPCTYAMQSSQNSCLFGKAAVRLDGTVLPCPMMDEYAVGDLHKDSLLKVLQSNKYNDIIYLSKENQDKCRHCVYRYGCSDCRAIEYNFTKDVKSNSLCGRTN